MSMVKFFMWENGPDATFEKVKKAGLSYFELSQVEMTDDFIERTIEASEKHGVTVIATSVNYKPLFGPNAKGFDIERDMEKIIAVNKKLGVKYVRDSLIPKDCPNNVEGYHIAAKDLNKYGKILKEEGLNLLYHNHHFEFEKFAGKMGFEILVEETDPEYVGFEVDVHWLQRAGCNPVEWIKRLKGREDLVHLKDYRIHFPDVEPTPELFHKDQCIQFAEIGEGNLDMPAIIDASLEVGAKYLPIEQDKCYDRDPFESAAISVANLKKMGYSHLF